MAVRTTTHTHTIRRFADPYKRCRWCGGWVDGVRVVDSAVIPCLHHDGYDDLCPSWGPVDGCRCQEHLGYIPHHERHRGS